MHLHDNDAPGCGARLVSFEWAARDMKNRHSSRLWPLVAEAVLTSWGPWAAAGSPTITVQRRVLQAGCSTYAAVEPIAALALRALQDGTLEGWKVRPGAQVRRGQVLGHLEGTEHAQEVASARARWRQAESVLAFARKNERVVQAAYPAVSDLQKVQAAQEGVAEAQASLGAARAHWQAVEAASVLRAPANGLVTEVLVGNHQPLTAGTVLLRMQDPAQLWLRGTFYGADAERVRPGMHGAFFPLAGGTPLPVRVVTVFPDLRSDGGRSVGCRTSGHPTWYSGEAGTLRLEGPPAVGPAVPDGALILDGMRWYVLVQHGKGFRRQEVTPGPAEGGWRWILKGVQPGETVLVKDAYLVFHRDVARSFTPPD